MKKKRVWHTQEMKDWIDDYNSMMEGATPLWSGPEDYEAWREKTLQNKQPWGMVPISMDEEGFASDWEAGNVASNRYTDPRNAGLEALFAGTTTPNDTVYRANRDWGDIKKDDYLRGGFDYESGENPELNWQNPSNKMFPWEPNYAAVMMGDKWMEDKMKGEQEMANRMGIFDASPHFGDQSDLSLAANYGGDTIGVNVNALKEAAEEGSFDWRDYWDYGILPHEFLHDLPRRKEITSMLPYELPEEGWNPMSNEKEIRPEGWEHDIIYNRDPIWWKHHSSRPTMEVADLYNRGEQTWVRGNLNEKFALNPEAAANQLALQRIGKSHVTGADMPSRESFWDKTSNYVPTRRPTMRDIAGPVTNLSRKGPSRAQQRLNTGGLASFML